MNQQQALDTTQSPCDDVLTAAIAVVRAYDKGIYLEDLEDAAANLKAVLDAKGVTYED